MRKFRKRVYDGSNDITEEKIGAYVCPVCNKGSSLMKRKGPGFQILVSRCGSHNCVIAKELYEKYKVGDRIRYYDSTFGKESVLKLDCYTEGVIVHSYPGIIDYMFDFKVDKCVMNGKKIKPPAWIIGNVTHCVSHSSQQVKLLNRAKKDSYEQLTLAF